MSPPPYLPSPHHSLLHRWNPILLPTATFLPAEIPSFRGQRSQFYAPDLRGTTTIPADRRGTTTMQPDLPGPGLEGAENLDPDQLLDPQRICSEKGASVPGGIGLFGLLVLVSGAGPCGAALLQPCGARSGCSSLAAVDNLGLLFHARTRRPCHALGNGGTSASLLVSAVMLLAVVLPCRYHPLLQGRPHRSASA